MRINRIKKKSPGLDKCKFRALSFMSKIEVDEQINDCDYVRVQKKKK